MNRAVTVLLEEFQRFTFGKFIEEAKDRLRTLIEGTLPTLGQAAWTRAKPERLRLANALLAMPAEPFQPASDNVQYWIDTVARAGALLERLYPAGAGADPEMVEAVATIYCASELLLEAVRAKVNTTSAYAQAIGAGGVVVDNVPFKAALQSQPSGPVKSAISARLGAPASGQLRYADLLAYLLHAPQIERLLRSVPVLNELVGLFKNDLERTERDLLAAFLGNVGAFAPGGSATSGPVDARDVLRRMVRGIDRFLTGTFTTSVLPQVLQHTPEPLLRMYLEEVIFAVVVHAKNIGLDTLLDWGGAGPHPDNADYSEALAGIMITLLGRSVVVVGDTLLTVSEEAAQRCCNDLAARIERNDASVQAIAGLLPDAEAREVIADAVRIGGEVLGPIPAETRRRVRRLLYQVFEPLPAASRNDFLSQLADDFFIPNGADLRALTDELLQLAGSRFVSFAEKVILKLGAYVLAELEKLIAAAVAFVLQWEKKLADSLDSLAASLRDADRALRRLNASVATAFARAGDSLHALLSTLGSNLLRRRLRSLILDEFVSRAFDELERNDVYKALPSDWRSFARRLAREAVDASMDNPLVNPIFNAIRQVANGLDDLLPDLHDLDPDDNLPEQIINLVLDRIEDQIRVHFGGTSPHIELTIRFSYDVPLFGTQHVHIDLGRIDISLRPFIRMIRDAVDALDEVHDLLTESALALGRAFADALEATAAQLRRDDLADRRDREARLSAERHSTGRELVVLSPTLLADYRDNVRFRIHVSGTGPSILGRERGEAAQLLVFVNGARIEARDMDVVIDPEYRSGSAIRPEADRNLNGASTLGARLALERRGPLAVVLPGVSSAGMGTQLGLAMPVQLQTESTISSAGHWSRVNKRFVDPSTGELLDRQEITPAAPGRAIGTREIEALSRDLVPGFDVRFVRSGPHVVKGANVLTVILINEGGARLEQTVTFTVRPRGAATRVPSRRVANDVPRITLNGLLAKKADDKPLPSNGPSFRVKGELSSPALVRSNGHIALEHRFTAIDTVLESLRPVERAALAERIERQRRELELRAGAPSEPPPA